MEKEDIDELIEFIEESADENKLIYLLDKIGIDFDKETEGERDMKGVELKKMIQELKLYNKTPDIDISAKRINTPEINRPALQLTGYLEHFANERVQIIGYVEYTYLLHLDREEKLKAFERFVSSKIPCIVFTTMTEPDEDMLNLANKYDVPILVTQNTTSAFMAEIIRWLGVQLAPCISIHGVLVDVYGEGILIMGESGIGVIRISGSKAYDVGDAIFKSKSSLPLAQRRDRSIQYGLIVDDDGKAVDEVILLIMNYVVSYKSTC